MTDKERVLTYVLHRLFMDNMFSDISTIEQYERASEKNMSIGDLVICTTSGIHDWTVGFLVEKGDGCFVKPWKIKELTSDKLCDISNDMFYKIDITVPKHVLLCGLERKIYNKCMKALQYSLLKYEDIEFSDKICTLKLRRSFSNDLEKEIEFNYNSKTTVKSIVRLIKEGE